MGQTIGKETQVEVMAERLGVTKKEAANFISEYNEYMREAVLAGDKFSLTGVGNIHRIWSEPRKGRNPQTGEELEIKAQYRPRFVPSGVLKRDLKDL